MLRNSILIVAITIILIPTSLKAQTDTEQIQTIITSFEKDLELLSTEGANRADKIMSYTNANLTYESKTINIMNIMTRDSYNQKKVSFLLHEMKASNVHAKRTVGKLDQISVRDKLALARFEIEYELFENNNLINKGVQYNQMFLRKNSEGKWLIEDIYVLNIDDKTYKSTCICEIYETKGLKSIMTETIVPDGHEVDIMEDKFSVDESTEPRQVRHGYKDYLWETSGTIYTRNTDGTEGRKVGMAKSRQELLLVLLKNEIYPDRCYQVIRKLK